MAVATAPPTGVQTWRFSYSRSNRKMRFHYGDDTWLIESLKGSWEILGTDSATGHLIVRCKLYIDEQGHATVWTPKDVDIEAYTCDLPENASESHWRLCYNRQAGHWRLRDERTQELLSNDILDYRGVMSVNWFDGGPHVFSDGKAHIDSEGVAHFAP